MNKERRKLIDIVDTRLKYCNDIKDYQFAIDELNKILSDEEDAFDNMPEGLQYSMRGEASQEAQDYLSEAIDELEQIIDLLNGETVDDEAVTDLIDDVHDNLTSAIYV